MQSLPPIASQKYTTKQWLAVLFSFFGTWGVYALWLAILLYSPDFPVDAGLLYLTVWWLANIGFVVLALGSIFFILFRLLIDSDQVLKFGRWLVISSAASVFVYCSYFYWVKFLTEKGSIPQIIQNLTVFSALILGTVFVIQLGLASASCWLALWLIGKTAYRKL